MNKINLLFTFCLIWIASVQLSAQSLSFSFGPTAITAAVDDEIDVEVRVGDGFDNLIGVQFGINYNGAALEYISVDNSSNPLGGDYSVAKRPNKSELINVWAHFSSNPASISLASGTLLYTIKFKVISTIGNSIDILCGDDEVGCEFSNESLQKFTDVIVDTQTDINGGGDSQNVGPIILDISDSSAETGTQNCVQFTASDFVDILSMQFSIQYDESVLAYSGTLQNLDNCPDDPASSVSNPLCIEAGNFNLFEPGTLTFSFSDFGSSNSFTLDDGTVIFDLCFDVIGAGGTSSDIVIDGDPTFIQIIKQGEGNENFGLTSNVGSVTVTGTGGALDVVSYTIGDGGGDMGTNVCIPVTVNDGFDDITGFGWSIDYDATIASYTGTQNINAAISTLGANESSAGNLSYIWNAAFSANSEVSLTDGTVLYEMCFDMIGDPGQVSFLDFSNFPNPIETVKIDGSDADSDQDLTIVNTTNGSATVTNSDGFNLSICEIDACPSDQVCIPILATGASEIASLGFTLEYDVNVLDFTGFNAVDNIRVNEPSNNEGHINVIYISFSNPPVELNLENCGQLGEFCFDVIGAQGTSSAVSITNDPTEYQASVIDDSGFPEEIDVASTNGSINVNCGGTAGEPIVTCDCGAAELTIDEAASLITDVACFGENTGSIALAISGGVAPYSFSWNTGATQQTLSDIAAGNYCVTVMDSDGESIDQCFDVAGPSSTLDINVVSAANGTIDIEVAGGEPTYTYSWNGPNVNNITTQDLSGLADGTYVVSVTDNGGCVSTQSIILDSSVDDLTIDGGATQVASITCFGESDGAISPSVTGGVTPYSYSWSSSNGFVSSSANISGLATGSYQLTVTDNAGTIVESIIFSIVEPATPLTASANITSESSPGQNDGGINLTVSGGTPGYNFAWNNNNFNEDNFALTMGTYTVTITDARGCVFTESYVVPFDADPLVIDANGSTVNNVRCFGDANGSISPSVNGGTEPYSYNWGFSTDKDISGLTAGEYTLTVTDAGGQSGIQTFVVQSPDQLAIAVGVIERETANGNDGAIFVNISGGTLTYAYSWTGPNGFTSTAEDITGLVEGTYTLTVIDINGCTQTRIIPLGALLNIENKFEIDVDCFGECTGEIDIVINGGLPPYLYTWAGPNGFSATTQDVNDLCAGVYTATISDSQGQEIFSTCRIDEPLLALSIAANPTIVNEVGPTNSSNGSINISVNGGTAPYNYQWSNQATSEDLTALQEGFYKVTVTDNNGCIVISPDYVVERVPLPVNIENLVITDPTCGGDCNGSTSFQIIGGDAPYTIIWSDGESLTLSSTNPSYSRNGLCAGSYTITVTDANGQPFPLSINLNDLGTISIASDITHETTGNDGAINTTVTGGTAPYDYDWAPSTLPSTADQENLSAGLYIVTVTDANDCSEIESFVIENNVGPLEISAFAITQIQCFGDESGSVNITASGGVMPYTFDWSDGQNTEDAIGLGAGTYTVTVRDADGAQVIEPYVINAPTQITTVSAVAGNPAVVINSDDLENDCMGSAFISPVGGQAPYSYVWSTSNEVTAQAVNLCAGPQTVTVIDASGCSEVFEFVILAEEDRPQADETITHVDCNGNATGAINLQVFGGTSPYTYQWNTGAETPNIEDLLPGTYFYTITDEQGAILESNGLVINEPPALDIEFTTTPETGIQTQDGCATAMPSGGSAPYTYQWNNPGNGGCNTAECCMLTEQTYFVVVQDAAGCIAVDSVVVANQFGGECMETRNIITPDGDGLNDSFLIQCSPGTINTIEIYNRWGQLVYLADNYDNAWQGTNRSGQELPAGGYFYVFILEDSVTGESVPYKGHITILRQ